MPSARKREGVGLYERYLSVRIARHDAESPDHVALVITERDLLERGAYETLADFFEWAFEYARRVTVYVSVLDADAIPALRRELETVDAPREIAVRTPDDPSQADAPIQIGIGLGGKHEFTAAVRTLAESVDAGELEPDEINDERVENHLVFPSEPDLVIKTGAERLSDFMIWQSVYSELYFTDVNWRDFRERDFLRAVREYCNRSRRFGR
ncbi:undecaprenyl pyrophosphate synthase [Natronococcus occultus SP4]|uniref:Undecaprenyl pyrophosphate synthase n=1 Tax=Natronococcus occultus SP4 TaxID=694430 RepID=L0K151_9EURY|nr:undecaprenyl pyrophosphate synthase [Natronococcus occultus SP4]